MIYMQTQQVLVPRQVFIGDTAEIRVSFEVDSVLLRNTIGQKENIELSNSYFTELVDDSKFDIKSVVISNVGYNQYSVVLSFVPWRTGKIQLPPFDLGSALNGDSEVYVIGFEPQEVISIVQTQGQTSLKDMNQTFLLPGTTYKIYGLLLLIGVVFVVICRLIIKRENVKFYFKNKMLLRKYNKNKKITCKNLQDLMFVKNLSDGEIATEIQKIMRFYLEERFDFPFTKTLSSEILNSFYKANENLISEHKIPSYEKIAQIFIRTDYIRYGNNNKFLLGEKEKLINALVSAIHIIETPQEKSVQEIVFDIQNKSEEKDA